MLINSLGLKNFKCFEELDVKFAPITLLTGANSSGKSSLINAILAVLQTEVFPLYLSPNGKYIEMGGMAEVVYNGSISLPVQINIEFDPARKSKFINLSNFIKTKINTSWSSDSQNGLPKLTSFLSVRDNVEISLKLTGDKIFLDILMDNFGEDIEDREAIYEIIVTKVSDAFKNKIIRNFSKEYKSINYSIEYNSIEDFENDLPKIDTYFFLGDNISEGIFKYKEYIDKRFNYVGSMRNSPARTYNQRSKVTPKIEVNGEGYIDQILEWKERSPNKFIKITKDASDLGLFDDMRPNRLSGGRFDLTVRTGNSKRWDSLTDIGFGVSQFLPIIVADHQLDYNSCLAISQPEIHLHPKIQAAFGNYLANQVKSTEKQYIIETHSEYLLNRIRLLLVTGELKPEDVCVLYFENDGIKSVTHNIEFATDGSVKGAPQGFFDTYGIDVMNIAMEAIG